MFTALVSLVMLLIYYSYREYVFRAKEFNKNANHVFEIAVQKTEEERLARIRAYWMQDMDDPNLVKVKAEKGPSGELSITVLNPETDEKELVFNLMSTEYPDTVTDEFLRDKFRKFVLSMGDSYVFLQDTIHARYQIYKDTIRTSPEQLKQNFKDQLSTFSIASDFDIVLSEDSILTEANSDLFSIQPIQMNEEKWSQYVSANFHQPFWEVLNEIKLVLLVNLFVLMFIALGFWQMLKTIKKQRELVRLKDDFIDNVTHELLTPVSTLTLGMDSLENYFEKGDSQKIKQYTALVKQEVNHISNLVKGVLQSSVAFQGQVKLKLKYFDLKSLMDGVRLYYLQKTDKALKITVTCEDNLTVYADKQHLINVLHNLIDNAIKYGDPLACEIDIVAEKVGDRLELRISDNGKGIPEEESERIFDKFHRVSQDDVHDVGGLGIGLYYVRTILARLNGTIKLEKSSPKGSTFKITIDQPQNADIH
ncbi:histidine kinase/DNA gyrase B/HSP90-like ATPase [Roseivirga ehrenbergii]|nr:histidine kinase/DNA gyrase B/HSP90-like ATPase [Roseivirga ehrenbergii]